MKTLVAVHKMGAAGDSEVRDKHHKKRNFSKFVICRIAKVVLSDQLFHARRRLRVGLVPYFRLIVGDRCERHSSGPF
jgi:hypothetical protein